MNRKAPVDMDWAELVREVVECRHIGTPAELRAMKEENERYKALEREGRLVVLPVPLGTTVFHRNILSIETWENEPVYPAPFELDDLPYIGTEIFLTAEECREAAEAKERETE